jgi:glycosyltransferase involved in cell wall biosynthesis
MKVSVICVCFNAQNTIEDSIKSVLNQTYQNIEYIVIDGASTDKTLEIIEKYKDKIDYFVSEPDSGIFNAMNKGIKAATGDILYFLNSNDYIFDEKVIEAVAGFFNKTNSDIVFGNMSFIENNGIEKERRIYADVDKLFFINECVCHQGIFYKRAVFDKCGLYD